MIEVKVRFFGVFKKYGTEVTLTVPVGITVRELGDQLDTAISCGKQMISESVFANDKEIMVLEDRLDSGCSISIMPPVCGG